MNTRRNLLAIALTAALLGAGHAQAQAQAGQRNIHVNGEHLNLAGMVVLDIMNCGQPVPSGRYWINWNNQTWGYEGRATASPLPDCTQSAGRPQQARSGGGQWEDRMHRNLCMRNGRCDVDIVINPVYQ